MNPGDTEMGDTGDCTTELYEMIVTEEMTPWNYTGNHIRNNLSDKK